MLRSCATICDFRDSAVSRPHSVDDLRVARHGLGLQVRPRREGVGTGKRDGCDLLVEIGDRQQQHAGGRDDQAEVRVDEEHDKQIDRRDRRVEHGQHGRPDEEAAHLLQVGKRLEFPVGAALSCFRRCAQHRSAELAFGLGRDTHEDEASDHVEHRLSQDDTNDHDGEHNQRVDASAAENTIGKLEEVDRNSQQQQVHGEGEGADHDEIAPAAGKSLAQDIAKVAVTGTALQRRIAATATAATAPTAGRKAARTVCQLRRRRPGPVERWACL
jgi:hypothetical protein